MTWGLRSPSRFYYFLILFLLKLPHRPHGPEPLRSPNLGLQKKLFFAIFPLNKFFFVTFRGHHNMKYKTYEDTAPCIASARWGKGLQANWSSFYVRFAYPMPPKSEKIAKKGPKNRLFTQGGNWEGGTGQGLGVASTFIRQGSSYANEISAQLGRFCALRVFKNTIFPIEKKNSKTGVHLSKVALSKRWIRDTGCSF
jgi:hypothetical protein